MARCTIALVRGQGRVFHSFRYVLNEGLDELVVLGGRGVLRLVVGAFARFENRESRLLGKLNSG